MLLKRSLDNGFDNFLA